MGFLKKLLGSKDTTIVHDHASFWSWFAENAATFHRAVKGNNNVDKNFLDKVMEKLGCLNNQFYCLAGMVDDATAELVITVEGDIKSIVFAEEIIASAPAIDGWRFTALKPPIGFDMTIEMNGYKFDKDKIHFISNNLAEYPDEIDITLVHQDFNGQNKDIITNGTLIYLDNALGEMNTALLIDNVSISGAPGKEELIPVAKLHDFLQWREKEFVEKYKGIRHHTENNSYTTLEAEDSEGLPVLAVLNQELLDWDAKPSHPWMMLIEIKYDGKNTNGMPSSEIYELMNQFEDELIRLLPDSDGYLNLGRQTYDSTRTMYFACKEFRTVSKITNSLINDFGDKLEISYRMYKDKYWITMNRFR